MEGGFTGLYEGRVCFGASNTSFTVSVATRVFLA